MCGKLPAAAEQTPNWIFFFRGYEQNIFPGSIEDPPLLFWRTWDPYWWNKSNVLPPGNLSILIHGCRCDGDSPLDQTREATSHCYC